MQPEIQLLVEGEDFLFCRHLSKLLKKCVDETTKDFNFSELDATRVPAVQIVEQLNTQPWMGGERTVLVQNFHALDKEDLVFFERYLQNPAPFSHLLLIADKIDKRKTFFKIFSKIGSVYEFKPLYENQVPAWFDQEVKTKGLKLEPGAVEMMVSMVGTDLMSLMQELDKLVTYVLPRTQITKEDVSKLVCAGSVQNIFLITNYLGNKSYARAVAIYRQMSEQGEAPHKILAMIIQHFRKLFLLKSAKNNCDLPSLLGVSPYFLKEYQTQAAKFALPVIKRAYQKLMHSALALRSTGASGDAIMESFFQGLCC